jgi:DDE superfamily endonuclease
MADLRGGPVTPELCVYLTLRYLASGGMDDIEVFISISKSTFYRCLSKTLYAINACHTLDILFPSSEEECFQLAKGFTRATKGGIGNCAGVVDGYLLCIDQPTQRDTKNQKSYFSGHYQRMGVNVQACCDSNAIFTYFAVTGPGVMGDRVAAREILPGTGSFLDKTETLPGLYVIIADAAYDATEKLVPMFFGAQRKCARNDNFNYVASRARINIEIAFGRMTNKWGILHRPLRQSLRNVTLIALSIARLHNFCAKERLMSPHFGDDQNYDPTPNGNNQTFLTTVPNFYREGCEFPVAPTNQPRLYRKLGTSHIRDMMAIQIEDLNISRPTSSPIYREALNENIIH